MKRLSIYIMLVAVFGMGSCNENETPVYDAGRASLNIWFGRTNSVIALLIIIRMLWKKDHLRLLPGLPEYRWITTVLSLLKS